MYVVVAAGLVVTDPLMDTSPMPWSIVTVSALATLHVRVEDSPGDMLWGSALKLIDGSGTTVTIAWAVDVPPLPDAVMMYVVVSAGETDNEPLSGTLPMPLSILTVSALEELHVKIADSPAAILWGEALKVTVGAGITVMVVCEVAVPPIPAAVIV